jgi:hypothetical protein
MQHLQYEEPVLRRRTGSGGFGLPLTLKPSIQGGWNPAGPIELRGPEEALKTSRALAR